MALTPLQKRITANGLIVGLAGFLIGKLYLKKSAKDSFKLAAMYMAVSIPTTLVLNHFSNKGESFKTSNETEHILGTRGGVNRNQKMSITPQL